MSENKKYYWLKLNENFFEDDTIAWLEEQSNGKDYVIFYLKLCLRSLKDDGKLIRYVGETLIPYDVTALAKLTNTHVDTVNTAMSAFEKIGLTQRLDTGEIYMKQINEMIGSETDAAKRKRKERAKKKLNLEEQSAICDNVTDMSHEGHTEKEIEKEIELDKETNTNKEKVSSSSSEENKYSEVLNFWQDNFGILNNFVIDNLRQWIDEMSPEVVMKALETSAGQDQYKYNYVNGILNNWYKKGLDTIEKIEANEVSFQNRKKQQSYKQQIREEPLPEWLTNDQQEEEPQELEDAEDIIGKLNELYE